MDFGDTRPCSSAKLYRLIKKCVTVTSDVTCSRQLLTSEEKRAPLVTALLRPLSAKNVPKDHNENILMNVMLLTGEEIGLVFESNC
uniref:NR LBD domain-containing protein n=1 Tax=Heterorhabditis bacteriophora TaxID=37862 RepID=A0A1I7W946_HETBA